MYNYQKYKNILDIFIYFKDTNKKIPLNKYLKFVCTYLQMFTCKINIYK